MDRIPRQVLICAFILLVLSSGCGAPSLPVDERLPDVSAQAASPVSAAAGQPTAMLAIPSNPITGNPLASVQCQFCVNNETHAVLIFPDFAYFDVLSSTPVRCSTADVVNGRRILLCRGAQSTSFSLNICSDSTNCLQFPVTLQPCELLQGGTPLVTPLSPVLPAPGNSANGPNPNPPASTNPSDPGDPTSPPPVLPTVAIPTAELPLPTAASTQAVEQEVVICHLPPGNPENGKTMTVSLSDWRNEHRGHGDSMGECD